MKSLLAFLFVLLTSQFGFAAEFEFKVLSYNVQGLPWPLKKDKGQLNRIGEVLGEMRANGSHPDVVFLQEAFTGDPVKKLIKNSGYKYVYKGPGPGVRPANSGIYILSDYKILRAEKLAFGSACAGLDCFSNKGVQVAELEVPGFPAPILVANTHMNSGKSSKVSPEKHIKSRADQIKKIGKLLKKIGTTNRTVFFGGDFNTSPNPKKAPWDVLTGTLAMPNAVEFCYANQGLCERLSSDSYDDFFYSSPDHVFYQAGQGVQLTPVTTEKTFKFNFGDKQISDHEGLEVVFRVVTE